MNTNDCDNGASLKRVVRRGWIYYKWTNLRGETYEKNIVVQHGRLAKLVVSAPDHALKILRDEMPQLQTLHVFACGEGESPNTGSP